MDKISYALSRKYVDETAIEFGGLKGAPCTIKSIVKENGVNTVTFEWKNSDGETRESVMRVNDGTPIYIWESGHSYNVNDLAINGDTFYKCLVANNDAVFNPLKWQSIGGGGGDSNYLIVQDSSMLPSTYTASDRKMAYSIEDSLFYLWDGTQWVLQQPHDCTNEQVQTLINLI